MRRIDADAARVKLQAARDKAPDGSAEKAAMDTFLYFLDACPTIEAEPVRHGTWQVWNSDCMRRNGKMQECRYYECSECWRRTAVKSNYCPNCGAKMDLEEKEE